MNKMLVIPTCTELLYRWNSKIRAWLRRFIKIKSLSFMLNIAIKDIFFVTRNNIAENRSFQYAERKLVTTFFEWHQIVDFDELRPSDKSRTLSRGLHFTKSIKLPWSRSDKWFVWGSYLIDISLERKFEN